MYKLLIVDDEKMIRQGIKDGIEWEKLGIAEVYTAASAEKAMDIIERIHPQIMLTDISMEKMTGLDLISRIRNSPDDKEMRIIVLSGYSQFDYAKQCLQMQVQNFLLKPVDEEELIRNVSQQLEVLEQNRISRELETKMKRSEGIRRQMALEQFMRELVHQRCQNGKSSSWPEEVLEERNSPVEAVLLIQDACINIDKLADINLLQMTIKNICMELVDFKREGVTFFDDDGRIIIAFFCSEEGDSVEEQAEELCKVLENECDVMVRLVLGSRVERMDLLFISYNDALYLSNLNMKGNHEVIKSSREETKGKIIQDVYQEFRQSMMADITNTGEMMHIYERFSQAMVSYHLSRQQVQRWCFDLAAGIYMAYIMETGEKPDGRVDTLLSVLIGTTREDALEVTRMFLSNLVADEEKNQHQIVTEARRYIDEHLDVDISVASLAEMFYVSPNYFSRLFKKISGCGCNKYIVEKRMAKARVLLETTTIKTGKIAIMVGYHDTNYFSLAFKKHIGMAPTIYRDTFQKTGKCRLCKIGEPLSGWR